ncbi:SDR family NAD(P)-dependent oxidoreductase [Granulicella sp. dw_53]|uniref:SDR family NAD(P)-dependent oxidoreductase n=1 Tax=Granulicella sp. dw_53 TaxID=2719792 RepID=UPI001BD43538|nr:SDR family NAD(P)-dependent oxidoreductase [Granulicella sp. dw_53]
MKKPSVTALHAAQLVTGIAAAAVAYALMPRTSRLGQVAVITGGSRGLGLALAERFGRAGAKLVLTARDLEELTRARSLLLERRAIKNPDDVLLIPADLTDPNQAASLIHHAIGHFGHIDVLINNAGIMEVGPVENQPLAAYRRAMATNFFAALYTTHAALPHLLDRGAKARTSSSLHPSIVNIASIGGKFAMPHLLPYVASKFALVGFSEGLHAELRHKGVRVTTVCPGLMRTGSHVQASFVGDQPKEYRWFALAATTPGIATSARHAANRIYNAVVDGRTEIVITPQAWLAARLTGLAPNTSQYLASLANEFILPNPLSEEQFILGFDPRAASSSRSRSLEAQHNQQPTLAYAPDPSQATFTFRNEDSENASWSVPADQPLM